MVSDCDFTWGVGHKEGIVLILVLMEDGLWRNKRSVAAVKAAKS